MQVLAVDLVDAHWRESDCGGNRLVYGKRCARNHYWRAPSSLSDNKTEKIKCEFRRRMLIDCSHELMIKTHFLIAHCSFLANLQPVACATSLSRFTSGDLVEWRQWVGVGGWDEGKSYSPSTDKHWLNWINFIFIVGQDLYSASRCLQRSTTVTHLLSAFCALFTLHASLDFMCAGQILSKRSFNYLQPMNCISVAPARHVTALNHSPCNQTIDVFWQAFCSILVSLSTVCVCLSRLYEQWWWL